MVTDVRLRAKIHYSHGAGEPRRRYVAVQCGAHERSLNEVWATDEKSRVTCRSCRKLGGY